MPARDTGDIKILVPGVGSDHLPHPRKAARHLFAPWISDQFTGHDIAFSWRTAVGGDKGHEAARDNARVLAFHDRAEAGDDAPVVTDPFRQPGLNLPGDVEQPDFAGVGEDETDVERAPEELLAERRIPRDLDHLDAHQPIGHGLIQVAVLLRVPQHFHVSPLSWWGITTWPGPGRPPGWWRACWPASSRSAWPGRPAAPGGRRQRGRGGPCPGGP